MYHPVYTRHFEKQIKKFPKKEQIKILDKISNSNTDPRSLSIKLESTKPAVYRLRADEYRVFFELNDSNKIMKIAKVECRTSQTYD